MIGLRKNQICKKNGVRWLMSRRCGRSSCNEERRTERRRHREHPERPEPEQAEPDRFVGNDERGDDDPDGHHELERTRVGAAAMGSTSRGKYTLVRSERSLMSTGAPFWTERLITFQGMSAAVRTTK